MGSCRPLLNRRESATEAEERPVHMGLEQPTEFASKGTKLSSPPTTTCVKLVVVRSIADKTKGYHRDRCFHEGRGRTTAEIVSERKAGGTSKVVGYLVDNK